MRILCILLDHLSTASDVCAHAHNKATTPERLPARFEVLGGQKRAEAAAWVLRSLIQRSLAVFTQPLRHLAFVRPLHALAETQQNPTQHRSIAITSSHAGLN